MSTATKTDGKMTAVEVLEWLLETHPDLCAVAELDRAWVWLPVDLRTKPEVRESIKEFGFKWAKNGHPLPSGATGTWAHHCDRPTRFNRGGGASKKSNEPNWEKIASDSGLSVEQLKAALQ